MSVAKELDRQTRSVFELVVSATDHGSPPLTGSVRVQIEVTISTNSPPKFTQDDYSVELYENMPANTIVLSLTTDSLSTVVYTISAGNEDGFFRVNPNSGVISTNMPVDFEQKQYFNLTVTATNMVSAVQTASVVVHVVDLNDNAPTFIRPVYVGNISEAAISGSMVLDLSRSPLVVQAADADSNNNARLFYHIMDPETQKFFTVDPNTGAVRTVAALDYETKQTFNFSVQVSDMGIPQLQAQRPAVVVISVTDVNDCPPRFHQHTYQATLLLPTYSDISVLQVLAVDPDTVSDKPLSYSILGGNHEQAFHIDSEKGVIFVTNDTLSKDRYELSVQASDGKMTSVARVVISVQQAGEATIKFTRDRFVLSVIVCPFTFSVVC